MSMKYIRTRGFPAAQTVKNLPTMQKTQVWSLGWEDPLEKGMATHSSILAWRIPWTEKPGRLQSMGLQRVGLSDWHLYFHFSYMDKQGSSTVKFVHHTSRKKGLIVQLRISPAFFSAEAKLPFQAGRLLASNEQSTLFPTVSFTWIILFLNLSTSRRLTHCSTISSNSAFSLRDIQMCS